MPPLPLWLWAVFLLIGAPLGVWIVHQTGPEWQRHILVGPILGFAIALGLALLTFGLFGAVRWGRARASLRKVREPERDDGRLVAPGRGGGELLEERHQLRVGEEPRDAYER